tara:strand:- start:749 stop:1279 length:531 start_codon:yes stop_codon:yes gene_type:complete
VEAPKNIMKKISKKVEHKKKQVEQEKRRQERAERRLEELQKLKKAQKEELMAIARKINKWLHAFYNSPDGDSIFDVERSVRVFVAKFLHGFPVPETDRSSFMRVTLHKGGELTYGDQYKGHPSRSNRLGYVSRGCVSAILPLRIFEYLHPEFIRQWAEAIDSEKIWKYIDNSIYCC